MNQRFRGCVLTAAVFAPLFLVGSVALGDGYVQTNLNSIDTTIPAANHDSDLVNSWGIARTATSPFWVGDNGSGLATIYNSAGIKQGLVVTIPPPAGGTPPATPTGVVANTTTDFAGSHFIFDTEDGTISSWTSGTSAILKVDNSSSNAVYKGVAIGNNGSNNLLYATNFRSGAVEAYGPTFAPTALAGSFTDPNLPSGFAPFGISNLGGDLFVTYAMQDPAKHDDVAGPGNGFVDEYDLNGNLLGRIASGGTLNSPWGLAIAPANFGAFSNDLLVGNFGDGAINAYQLTGNTGTFAGQLADPLGNTLAIDGLWGLIFGGGGASNGPTSTLFFTAGPSDESQGLFGSIVSVPEPASASLLALGAFGLLRRRTARRRA